jgi:ferrous iron transport protein A
VAFLNELRVGNRATVVAVHDGGPITQRLLEMGMVEGEEIEVIAVAPLGDPIEVRLRNYRLSVRRSEAALVQVNSAK